MTATCPCCGGAVRDDADLIWDAKSLSLTGRGYAVHLSRQQAALFDFLWKARKSGAQHTREQLLEVIYADRADGGSDCLKVPYVVANHINKRISPFGLRISRGRLLDLTHDKGAERNVA